MFLTAPIVIFIILKNKTLGFLLALGLFSTSTGIVTYYWYVYNWNFLIAVENDFDKYY